jgi:hypothetical protein
LDFARSGDLIAFQISFPLIFPGHLAPLCERAGDVFGAVSKTVDGGNVAREFESLPLRYKSEPATILLAVKHWQRALFLLDPRRVWLVARQADGQFQAEREPAVIPSVGLDRPDRRSPELR